MVPNLTSDLGSSSSFRLSTGFTGDCFAAGACRDPFAF